MRDTYRDVTTLLKARLLTICVKDCINVAVFQSMVKIETERFFVIGLQHLILVELLPCENLPPIKLNLIDLNRIKVSLFSTSVITK